MSARDFCYWLMGKLEIDAASGGILTDSRSVGLSAAQVDVIARHLEMVFAHDLDPKAGGPEVQEKLNKIHHGTFKDAVMRC